MRVAKPCTPEDCPTVGQSCLRGWPIGPSERKFKSHPTVPPGRLNELAFAIADRKVGFALLNCSGGSNPMPSPNGEQ